MLPLRRLLPRSRSLGTTFGLALAMLLVAWGTPAQAVIGDVGFTINIAEKEKVLQTRWEVANLPAGQGIQLPNMANPVDPALWVMTGDKSAMWDTAEVRRANRMMPWIEVTNNPQSTGNLTQFRMSIGDTSFNFTDDMMGTYAMEGQKMTIPINVPDLDFSIASAQLVTDQGALLGDELLVTFGNGGLAPGETARFKVFLHGDPGNLVMPDYREIFGNANASNTVNPNDDFDTNSVFSAVFADFNNPNLTLQTDPMALADFVIEGAPFFNSNTVLRPYSVMEPVQIFGGLSTGGQGEVIPEPATAGLAMACALVGCWGVRRRLRR
jgi:hypothetical protein